MSTDHIQCDYDLFYDVIRETIENNRKLENKRKIFIFNFFDDFIILDDREHQHAPSGQILSNLNNLNKQYGFYEQINKNHRKQ